LGSRIDRPDGRYAPEFCPKVEIEASAADMIQEKSMIRKLPSGEYRLYSKKQNPKTGKRRNLGTFKSRTAAEKHEKAVQFFKRRG
jgi:hypothetical protein